MAQFGAGSINRIRLSALLLLFLGALAMGSSAPVADSAGTVDVTPQVRFPLFLRPAVVNHLANPSFEGGWCDPCEVNELQIPDRYQFWFADESENNPYDPNEWSKFVRPEVRVLSSAFLPEEEHDLFILHGDHTLKIFKGYGSWQAELWQSVALEPGRYRLSVQIFGDLVKYYENGQKVWADDPGGHDGLVWLSFDGRPLVEERSLRAGEWNVISADFETYDGGDFLLRIICPFPLNNNGLFMDDWRIEQLH
jgi:hypothetical protein